MERSGTDTVDALNRLEAALVAAEVAAIAHLAPGVGPDVVDATIADVPTVQPHPALHAWFGWRNGTDLEQPDRGGGIYRHEEQHLVGGWYFLGLSDAVRLHRRMFDDAREDGVPESYPDGWFPILYFDGGGQLCVDTLSSKGTLYVADWRSALPDIPPREQFADVADMATTFAMLFEDGLARRSPELDGFHVDLDGLPEHLRDRPALW